MIYFAQKLIPYLALVFIYLAVATNFWRDAKMPTKRKFSNLRTAMLGLGLLIHACLLYQVILAHGFNLGFFNVLSVIAWLTVLIYGLADLKHNLAGLQAFILPQAAIFALLPAYNVANHYLPSAESPLLLAHIAIALLAYSLFTFATLHALLMTIAERSLHNKSILIKLPSFPPLMVMETLLFQIIGLGFILLTITLISGMLFSEQIFGKPMQFNHKTIFSIASWIIYGALLFGRIQYGWRGIKAIRWTLVGFVLLLLAYVGSKFILQVILGR
ncbi:MAG: cytochrome C biogenesis protein [Methylotenera sp.]|nr:cytochrome C biogenesis protein [Methylotenera sp.]MSP99725.1 cytochrome C biogenesis protein [Methylotenera sp.]